MLNTDSIKNKEVINICDGKSMGYVCDIEINLKEGRIEGIIIPRQKGLFSFLGKESEEFVIKWRDVRTVGDDVILVEVPVTLDSNC